MSRFAAGQRWRYATRPGEEASRVTILLVETTYAGPMVHVAVDQIRLVNAVRDDVILGISFMPMREAELEASVTELESEDPSFTPTEDFVTGHASWLEQHHSGKAGFWTTPIARVIQSLEDGMKRQ